MDYMGSGFRAGFRRGLRVAWDAMCFRPLRFEPWPAPSMPSLREHLESYGGIGMAARRVRPVAGRALGRSGRKETAPVQGERDRGSCASAGPVDPGMRVDDRAA